MIVNGYAYPTTVHTALNWWLSRLTWLSVFSYGITESGRLTVLDDEELIRAANNAGVRPLMVLAPIDDKGQFAPDAFVAVLNDPAARSSLLYEIQANIRTKGMGGINFDVEYLPAEYASAYAEFIKDMQKMLSPLGYLTTVALAPKISSDQKGVLYEGHDYKKLGEAADYCIIMTYEWGYTYGEPLPVSPITNVRHVLEYAMSQIAPSKILMGLNNYGYDWTLPFIKGESRAETLGNYQAAARAEYYGVPVLWDETAMAPYFNYTDPYGREHIVWFENERSWQARIAMADEMGLAGVSIWTIKKIFYGGI